MFTPPVIAFQIAIAAIILFAAYSGGSLMFILAVILVVGWTVGMVFGPLLILQLGTIALVSLAAIYLFFPQTFSDSKDEKLLNFNNQSETAINNPPIIQEKQPYKTDEKQFRENKSGSPVSNTTPLPQPLILGKLYTPEQLDTIFNFDYKGRAGIKSSVKGELVLFINDDQSKYQNVQTGNTIIFQGQNTGKGDQKLIYGNKKLYDAYDEPSTPIYLFKNYIYIGQYILSAKPFFKNGKWFFPISPKP
jgi:hypothetical protein